MQYRNAVALLESLQIMLTACLDEHRRQGIDFNFKAWAALRDLAESPAFEKAVEKLNQRKEYRAFTAELLELITDVGRVVQADQDLPPEEREKRLREAWPLFTEADLQDEGDAANRIHNAELAKLAWAKAPENRVDHSVRSRLHIVEMLESILEAGKIIMISKDADGGYQGTADRKPSSASTLEGCIEGFTDHPRMKICLREGCKSKGRPKPLWAFPPDKDAKDGHSGACHECESTRQKRIQARRRKSKDVPQPSEPGPTGSLAK